MNYEREQHLLSVGWLDHSALTPPRSGYVGEHVYAQAWTTFMNMLSDGSAPPNEALGDILQLCEPLTQRHASVAASFVQWLGTNCGLAFVSECRRAETAQAGCFSRIPARAWLGQWGWSNFRRIGVNGGYRTIEHILASRENYGAGAHGITMLVSAPDVSAEDCETIEQLVAWLPSERGQKFLAVCDLEIEERRDEHHLRNRHARQRGGA